MKKKMKNLNFFFLLLFVSCTSLSQKLQNILEKKEPKIIVETKKIKNYCDLKTHNQSLLENPEYFQNLLLKNTSSSFIEKSVMLSLIEMGRRPDIVTPYSRLQVIARVNGEVQYFDFRPKNFEDQNLTPFLYGLHFLLKKYNSPRSLFYLAKQVDTNVLPNYSVSSEFEAFLVENKVDIGKNSDLTKLYLKGDEVMTHFETFFRPSLMKSIEKLEKQNYFNNSNYEFSKNSLTYANTDEQKNISACNFDINQEAITVNDLAFDNEYASHTYSYIENDNYFFAITSSHLKKPLALTEDSYLKSRPLTSPIPICRLSNRTFNSEIILTSTKGRNPAQHIKHLINYDIINSPTLEILSGTMNFARHLFLSNPDRILYESKKGRKEQLNFFLQMDFPIYHVDQLGELMGLVTFYKNKTHSLIKDERGNKQLTCAP